jgi:hypothetical protein
MTTAVATPTVADLAARWSETATSDELAAIDRSRRAFVNSHGTGLLTTDELRGMYRMYVQDGTTRQNGMMYALAEAIRTAVESTPYGSLSSWEARRQHHADARQARRDRAAAGRQARAARLAAEAAPSVVPTDEQRRTTIARNMPVSTSGYVAPADDSTPPWMR